MSTVTLFVVLTMLNHQPQPMHKVMDNLADCLSEVHAILESPTIAKLPDGGTLQAGCVIQAAPSTDL